jgi:hypothetical protein
VYVDDLNIFGSTQDIDEARDHLKLEFEMKDLGKKNCLGLQIENLQSGMLVHQFVYIQKILKKFNTDKPYPITPPWLFGHGT